MTYPAHGPQALFLVLSGPSGSGKSTVIQRFLARNPGVIRCLSVTTRAPRGAEKDGVDYLDSEDGGEALKQRSLLLFQFVLYYFYLVLHLLLIE